MSKKHSLKEIELKDRFDENQVHLTQERKIIPKEVKNLHYVLKNYTNLNKYSWKVDGERVILNKKS
jgi:hypothetical protein